MADSTFGRKATCRRLGDGRIGIWCDFDDKEHAKALPGSRWDKYLKCWTVPELFELDARALVDRLNARMRTTSGTSLVALSTAFKSMFDALAQPMRRPVHRALSRVLHPDTGGDEAAMKALNEAWGDR